MNDVLFAYDGSESSSAALRAAVALLPGARFVVLVVRGNPIQIGQAGAARIALPDAVVRKGLGELERETASRGAALADAGVAIVRDAGADAEPAVVAAGSPWRAILEESRRRDSDLVACGSRGLGGFGRAVLGSTSSALVHNADRPVLALPDGKTPVDGPLLIAYDGSEPARAAIRAAAKLFPGREAIVAHAWHSPTRESLAYGALLAAPDAAVRDIAREFDERKRVIASTLAEDGAALAAGMGLDARAVLVPATASEWSAIAGEADRAEASVVVAGSRGQGAVLRTLLGSASSGLTHNAERPTLIVSHEGPALGAA